uniref:AMP-binding domain-containing protein n=1 Tax=Caenorhabditis tropicalis TaxID=1561998 RepID=A0A1I7V163_9PELO
MGNPNLTSLVGNLYIGSNVKQRAQLGENYLDGTQVVAVRGESKEIGLISQILKDHGAHVSEFRYDLSRLAEISRAIRQADILLDGVQEGGEIEEASASNPRLIVAECDCEDPFSSMSAVARISMALATRERTGHGQRLIASDCLDYWRHLNRFGRK